MSKWWARERERSPNAVLYLRIRSFAASRRFSRFLRKLGGVRLFMQMERTWPRIVPGLLFDAAALYPRPGGPDDGAFRRGRNPVCVKKVMVSEEEEYSHLSQKRISFTISVLDSISQLIYSYLLVLQPKNLKKFSTTRVDMKEHRRKRTSLGLIDYIFLL
jgi:hypothetical protein